MHSKVLDLFLLDASVASIYPVKYLTSITCVVVPAAMASQEVDREPLNVSGLGDNGDFSQAIERLSDALNLNPTNVTLYSNRAAAYMRVCKYAEALNDANRALELKPDWTKVRRGWEGRGGEGMGMGSEGKRIGWEPGVEVRRGEGRGGARGG